MSGLNPAGVQVTSFKQPTSAELAHGWLWRHIVALPPRGQIGIFNRSHYEEVVAVRVHPQWLAAQAIDPARGEQARVLEGALRGHPDVGALPNRSGTRVVKFFLHVSRDEQRQRFLDRVAEPEKNWKFSPERRRGAQALGRLPARVRRGARRDEHEGIALVRDPRRPQVVHADGGRLDPGPSPGRTWTRSSPSRREDRATMGRGQGARGGVRRRRPRRPPARSGGLRSEGGGAARLDRLDDPRVHGGHRAVEAAEGRPRHHGHAHGRGRRDRRHAGLVPDQRHLAEEVALAQLRDPRSAADDLARPP